METVLNMVIDPDNVRMLLMVVLGWSGFVLIKSQMKEMGHSLNKRIDGVEASLSKQIGELDHKINMVELSLSKQIYDLRHNLSDTIKALTYALEKNDALDKSDKEYVDSRLAH